MTTFAAVGAPQSLPRQAPTAGQVFSVPTLDGRYRYYQAPVGSSVATNDDYPVPVVAHPNEIGVSSIAIGRIMPPGCVMIGEGEEAVGSVTAMPGLIPPDTKSLGLGLGKMSGFGDVPTKSFTLFGQQIVLGPSLVGSVGLIVGFWAMGAWLDKHALAQKKKDSK